MTNKGTFGVGTSTYHLFNGKRENTDASIDGHRELMLKIWYPTTPTPGTNWYNSDALENTRQFVLQRSHLPRWLASICVRSIPLRSISNAPLSSRESTYPVILIAHGAPTMIEHYTWLYEEIASQGYIVVGFNQPHVAAVARFPGGRAIRTLVLAKKKEGQTNYRAWKNQQLEIGVKDVQFALDAVERWNTDPSSPFFTRLNLNQIGMCGHSYGGNLTLLMSHRDKRIKASINMDGSLLEKNFETPIEVPCLNLLPEKGRLSQRERKALETMSAKPGSQVYVQTLRAVGHGVFTDLPMLLHSNWVGRLMSHFIDVDIGASSNKACKTIEDVKSRIIGFFGENISRSQCRIVDGENPAHHTRRTFPT